MRSDGEKSPRSTAVTVPKKKRGFCECCQETFEELQKVKAPPGPVSLQKLQGPLGSLVMVMCLFATRTLPEGGPAAVRAALVVSPRISLVDEHHSVSVTSWSVQTMVLKLRARRAHLWG